MARVEVVGDRLSIQIEGMDKLWSLKSHLEIPLAHVTGAEADPEAVRDWRGWRGPGTHLPGVVAAGTFHHQSDRVFWDVHDAARAVMIHLPTSATTAWWSASTTGPDRGRHPTGARDDG